MVEAGTEAAVGMGGMAGAEATAGAVVMVGILDGAMADGAVAGVLASGRA